MLLHTIYVAGFVCDVLTCVNYTKVQNLACLASITCMCLEYVLSLRYINEKVMQQSISEGGFQNSNMAHECLPTN